MNLKAIGWQTHFSDQMERYPDCVAGRVSLVQRDHFQLWTESGVCMGEPSGRLRAESALWPVTGDWVALARDGSIEAVLDRKTVLERKQPGKNIASQVLAANLDVLFVVTGLDGDFNPRRLERYLVAAREGGIRPVLVLNKADLHGDLTSVLTTTRGLGRDVEVLAVSARTGAGMEGLKAFCRWGETAGMAGSSGVGKSTILNFLAGEEMEATQPVREHDHRGQHTTTHRKLFLLEAGWMLMDLPGIREIQPMAGAEAIEDAFADIREWAGLCQFRDCRHEAEPGCAVVGNVSRERIAAYRKLEKESAFLRRQVDVGAAAAEKAKWKSIHKAMRKGGKLRDRD